MPEFSNLIHARQNNPHHRFYSVGNHSLEALSIMSKWTNWLHLRLAALLHDIGKPLCKTTDENGIDHFYGHEKESAILSEEILRRMKYDNETIKKVRELIYWHGIPIQASKKSIRRALGKIGEEYFLDLLTLKDSDDYAKKQTLDVNARIARRIEVREIYKEILADKECFKLKDLAIDGKDLIGIGFEEGKFIGLILETFLSSVVNEPNINKESILLTVAHDVYENRDVIIVGSHEESMEIMSIYISTSLDQLKREMGI